jgi:hypothetical protein
VSGSVWAVSAYSAFLVLVAYGFDLMARTTARRSERWRTGTFIYKDSHDAWVCREDEWLWPVSFDPDQRTMRYRANPIVCNDCTLKSACTDSDDGREIIRDIDPWPHSESGRFHRGIAACIAAIGVLLPLGSMIRGGTALDAVVLLVVATLAAATSLPLVSHLRKCPTNFPEHVPLERDDAVADAGPGQLLGHDRFTTRWSFTQDEGAHR